MKKFNNYQYYFDDKGTIYAVSSYAGKAVRGKASCNPNDKFDAWIGKTLAAKRCNLKVAGKRYTRAAAQFEEAQEIYDKALRALEKAESYYVDASRALIKANAELDEFEKELED